LKKHRSWKRWLADLMIVAGVLLLLYPIGTWGYTWFAQRSLRHELEQANPQITAQNASLNNGDFVSIATRASNSASASAGTGLSGTVGTTEVTTDPAVAAGAAAAAERQMQLAAFRAAADQYAQSVSGQTGKPIGTIVIPSIGMNVVMVEGTGKGDLREGPGHWPETPFPGQSGNFVVSGHRTTYGAPFLKLNKVKVGDEIDVVLPYAVARYQVTRVIIVLPTQVDEVAQKGIEQVSLAACHPLYSASHRIVVQGNLVSFKLL
jgi:LPXTG-site transpeptidase (sortase) family protein